MLLPFESVVRRGVVFLYPRFPLLADPAFAGETKPKYLVMLSSSPLDDPILYLLTTSEKPKHLTSALQAEFMHIPSGKYYFLPKGTIINVAEAGELTFDREDLRALYESGDVVYQGVLDDGDIAALLQLIQASRRVPARVKQILGH